jgi:transcription elongation factor GreA
MPAEIPITPEGLEQVKRELQELTTVKRPYIVEKIKTAREFGDLSENFEYHSAKNEQGFIEARIQELEAIVKNAVIVEAKAASTGRVELLSTVRFQEDGSAEESYRIVPPTEADATAGKISLDSALGRALIGRKIGDEVEVETPNGAYSVRITAIE